MHNSEFGFMYILISGTPCNVTRNFAVRQRRFTVTFSSDDPETVFFCRLDKKRFERCKYT